ncbi:hypothetical protein AHN09_004593 [Salmonella enterica subsp. enterica]|nr:hypothetical protein [Salmonella enterica subsp. enterica]
MVITQTEYENIFKDYYINGVAVRDTGYIYITLREKAEIVPVMQEHLAKKNLYLFFTMNQWVNNGGRVAMKVWIIYYPPRPPYLIASMLA